MLELLMTVVVYACVFFVAAWVLVILVINAIGVVGWTVAIVWSVLEEVWGAIADRLPGLRSQTYR